MAAVEGSPKNRAHQHDRSFCLDAPGLKGRSEGAQLIGSDGVQALVAEEGHAALSEQRPVPYPRCRAVGGHELHLERALNERAVREATPLRDLLAVLDASRLGGALHQPRRLRERRIVVLHGRIAAEAAANAVLVRISKVNEPAGLTAPD